MPQRTTPETATERENRLIDLMWMLFKLAATSHRFRYLKHAELKEEFRKVLIADGFTPPEELK